MAHSKSWTRRHILGATAAAATAVSFHPMRGAVAQPAVKRGTKLSYWGGLIFSDKANKLLVETITKWGADNGVQTEVVMVNQNETTRQVSAAVGANTMPDALDLQIDLQLLLARQNVLAPLDDVFDRIGKAQGGWYPSRSVGGGR